jgi:hypothetical protein
VGERGNEYVDVATPPYRLVGEKLHPHFYLNNKGERVSLSLSIR